MWLTQSDMAILYGTTIPNISMHITNIFNENELEKNSVIKKFLTTAIDGKQYNTTYYNIDVVLAVGYRVNSKRGIEFRKWANKVLKQYLIKGYSINNKRCLEHSDILVSLSNDMNLIKDEINNIKSDLNGVKQVISDPFYDKHYLIKNGERIESDIAYQEIYKLAKESIYIIDDYINIKTLQLLKSCNKNISIVIVSDNKSVDGIKDEYIIDFKKDTNIDITLKKNKGLFHSRYIVIDYKTDNYILFFCGGSSKDGGNKINTIVEVEDKDTYRVLMDKIV